MCSGPGDTGITAQNLNPGEKAERQTYAEQLGCAKTTLRTCRARNEGMWGDGEGESVGPGNKLANTKPGNTNRDRAIHLQTKAETRWWWWQR